MNPADRAGEDGPGTRRTGRVRTARALRGGPGGGGEPVNLADRAGEDGQ
ncbi:MAG: hypothetical protein LBT40_15490 [Deltaproteobacteria bacterium]|nr:hypothetical protein [Deltaproteobacteria bacterium]